MPELRFDVPARASHIDVMARWGPRIAVAAAFATIGVGKFEAHSSWIAIFDALGFGQWFRYATGILQVCGAVLVLIPRTFLAGIVLLSATMAGAMGAWIFRLGHPGNATIPGLILAGLVIVGLSGRRS